MDGSHTAPSQLSNAERKKRISQAWFKHIRKFPTSSENPVIQHRLVFSMSSELHDNLVNAGLSPDRVLQSTMKKIMGKFADRFHADDAIGYAYGIHHDTDKLHVHVAHRKLRKQESDKIPSHLFRAGKHAMERTS